MESATEPVEVSEDDAGGARRPQERELAGPTFDAGCLAALGKPYITLHDEDLVHALKEVDGAALAWATTPSTGID